MRDDHGGRFNFGPHLPLRAYNHPRRRSTDEENSADEVVGEIGLVLVVVLGIVLAINMALLALHIG